MAVPETFRNWKGGSDSVKLAFRIRAKRPAVSGSAMRA
jgi:hypothetical protein